MKHIYIFLVLAFSSSAFALDYGNEENDQYGNPNYRYEGMSGQRYQYDLSNPGDQLKYELDLDAQMRDEINPSPMIELDRGMGTYGGGAEW